VTITKGGAVYSDYGLEGWVDKYDQTKRDGKGSTWRGIKDGGRTSPQRYKTRREAADWVATP